MSLINFRIWLFVLLLIGGFSIPVYGVSPETTEEELNKTYFCADSGSDSTECDCSGYSDERCGGFRCQHPTYGWITYGYDVGPCAGYCCSGFPYSPVIIPVWTIEGEGCCPWYDCPLNSYDWPFGEDIYGPDSEIFGWGWSWDGMPASFSDWNSLGADFPGFDPAYWNDWNSGGMYEGMGDPWVSFPDDYPFSDWGYMNFGEPVFSDPDSPLFYGETDKSVISGDMENVTPLIAPLIGYLPNGTPAYLTDTGDISTTCPEGYFCAYPIDPDPGEKGIIFMEPLNWLVYPFRFGTINKSGNGT